MAAELQYFDREESGRQVTYTSRINPQRKVIVTARAILPIGNWANAEGEQSETPALFAVALDDQKALLAAREAEQRDRQTETGGAPSETPRSRRAAKERQPDDGLG